MAMGNADGIGAVNPGGAAKPGGTSIGNPRPMGSVPGVCMPGGGNPRKLCGVGWGKNGMLGRGPIIPGIMDAWLAKPFSPGGILAIPSPGGPGMPGGGPMGGIGDDGWPCGADMACCGTGGFVSIERGIDCACDCEEGDVDLLVANVA